MISCDSQRWSYLATWFPVSVNACLVNLCTGWWGCSSGCCVLRLWQNSACWVLGESCRKQGTGELLGLISSNLLAINLFVSTNVCHLRGWFDTVFRLSQEVVIFWLVANQCKFYRGTQARIGNIWGKYDYGYSRMSLYINGNVLTARFLVTGNYCILFDSGQLLKHDQGVPCRSMTKHDQTNSHQTCLSAWWAEGTLLKHDQGVPWSPFWLSYFRYLRIVSCRAGVDHGISKSPFIRKWIDLRNHCHSEQPHPAWTIWKNT